MKIKATRAFYIAGEVVKSGAIIEVDDRFGRELLAMNKAEAADAKPAKKQKAAAVDAPEPGDPVSQAATESAA